MQSRSTDELSRCYGDDAVDKRNNRMAHSFTCASDGDTFQESESNVDDGHHTSWQPMVWLSEKGRKLSEFLDRGRGRQQSPDSMQRRDKKTKPRSLSVERGMKLSHPSEDDRAILRSKEAESEGHELSKRWCYVYQDNEGIKLGSLSKESKQEKDAKDDNEAKTETSPVSDELALTKQVIIHRDERGYGLSVSGDNPVFVRSVKENGPAAKAGIQVGDPATSSEKTLTRSSHYTGRKME
ncbi:hypothetical protein LSH36_51g06010 [Paralvinella palmiformis]|uniref:PDZ domain-containing protein n=1 Tax=Paralvinella palmiformis TaxID=53620 RepID=A0AAD9K7E4_9ANNE|nr:hypothetical protein LSH36_51g06010 [Paralvinella palmiformis]